VQKALAGAKNDPLLAQNLSSTFNGQTMSVMLSEHSLAAQP